MRYAHMRWRTPGTHPRPARMRDSQLRCERSSRRATHLLLPTLLSHARLLHAQSPNTKCSSTQQKHVPPLPPWLLYLPYSRFALNFSMQRRPLSLPLSLLIALGVSFLVTACSRPFSACGAIMWFRFRIRLMVLMAASTVWPWVLVLCSVGLLSMQHHNPPVHAASSGRPGRPWRFLPGKNRIFRTPATGVAEPDFEAAARVYCSQLLGVAGGCGCGCG